MNVWKRAQRLVDDFAQCRKLADAQRKAEATLIHHVEMQLAAVAARRASTTSPRRNGRNLVMGLVAGYGESDLAPFVDSLREHGYDGDITLLTFDITPATAAFLASRQVRQLAFDSMPLLAMSMNSARMLKYLEFLRTDGFDTQGQPVYDHIMLVDVRDIVFQGDPFARVDGADIYYFLETGRTIGTCPINAAWIEQALGRNTLRHMAASRISCAGTLIATPIALMEYLLHMTLAIARTNPAVRQTGIDQAIHNYLMFNGTIANARVVENGGAVMTVPADYPHGMVVASDGSLRNADGSMSETVHQYDHSAAMLAAVMDRYRR